MWYQTAAYELPHDKTNKMACVPSEDSDRSAWASAQFDQSSLCAQWVAKDPSFLHADSEASDQTGRTCHFVGFVMRQLNYFCGSEGSSPKDIGTD